ncbi:hypothetical protein, partial [Streptococcus thermophilus]|uniref:hypothetical protein n=2 Tax=Streptococcus thermophilus TaxID=1308 RepID=UPI0021A86554
LSHRNKSLSSNVSQLYYNGFIPFCVYTTYFTLPNKKTILYNKSRGELYEVSEIYFHFLESIRNKKICQDALKQRYNTENIDIEKIKGNLPN